MNITFGEVKERLCKLTSKIGSEVFKEKYPHDCWCNDLPPKNFLFDEKIIEYIEDAVKQYSGE